MLKAISTLISQISSLANATVPLSGSETVPIDQSGAKKVTVANLTKGRTIQTTGINDNNNNEVITITTTALAVNELTVANAATGANPVISATGSDTNIGITLTPKGTGNAVLTTGNLVVANGNGIDFSATSGTGTSELLADYEEGTWTPTISDGTNNATMGSAGSNAGWYTKIGRVVFISGNVATTSLGSVSGAIRITGLPFTANSAVGQNNGLCVGYAGGFAITANQVVTGFANGGSTYIALYVWTATTGTTAMQATQWTNSGNMQFSMVYSV